MKNTSTLSIPRGVYSRTAKFNTFHKIQLLTFCLFHGQVLEHGDYNSDYSILNQHFE